ncbi:unnamed protein product [Haemonchus placei]|uniref:Uncharacterized protein n=1 Tax=Haemonchus placei TaxID=6290 RepID=A0A0N4VVH7_HAEPC|nr:unnamed protein product [Haemonchus placei]
MIGRAFADKFNSERIGARFDGDDDEGGEEGKQKRADIDDGVGPRGATGEGGEEDGKKRHLGRNEDESVVCGVWGYISEP